MSNSQTAIHTSNTIRQKDMSNTVNNILPMSFNSLVLETMTRCNARCDMCYQAAGPKGSEILGDHVLLDTDVIRAIHEATEIEGLSPRLHISGGEIFIQPERHYEHIRIAKNTGFYNDIGVTTNAFWAKNPKKAEEVVRRCRQSGLVNMEISWDFWHKEYLSSEAVSNALVACANNDIHANLRVLTTKKHFFDEALQLLRADAIDAVSQITSGPVFPTGRAEQKIDQKEIFYSDITGSCFSVLNLAINAKGDVYPCCASADQTRGLIMGNIRERSLSDIVAKMRRSPLLRTVVFQGVSALLPLLNDCQSMQKKKYASMCHLCFDIFSDEKKTSIIEQYFDEKIGAALIRAVSTYQDHLEKK